MSGSEQMLKIIESMDVNRLSNILNEAQVWIRSNSQQARDELIDNPELRFALFNIPLILDKRYRDIRAGRLELPKENKQPKHQSSGSYHNPAMQGQFYDMSAIQKQDKAATNSGNKSDSNSNNMNKYQQQMYTNYQMYQGNNFQQQGGFPQQMYDYQYDYQMGQQGYGQMQQNAYQGFGQMQGNPFNQQQMYANFQNYQQNYVNQQQYTGGNNNNNNE